ncbi:DUF5701 family protein [Actinomyces polynesiensis]|uniref:DUF5701 family protein n=1 Tax=Actinomyces polynesiensis TaxID=1325934 RepID=UPI000AE731AF|nr:DUF5701 family protein [Actinomyces polynesiensis]
MRQPTLSVGDQIGLLESSGAFGVSLDADAVRAAAHRLIEEVPDEVALVALHPRWFRASDLAPLVRREGKAGFVVADMTDVDEFLPVGVRLPDSPLYLVRGVSRGDDLRNASPEEALREFDATGRRGLTLQEGLSWALTDPGVIEPNACFMTIASRKQKGATRTGEPVFDTRTPALWISGGTGRDGAEQRNAPKVGWCWWRNRHTWLGISSAER